MGNIICFDDGSPVQDCLHMSNGAADVFINVLVLSGSSLAETESEKRLIVWLAERDQTLGLGTAGFSVTEMPWQRSTFAGDRAFMLRVVRAAENRLGWDMLDYIPAYPPLFSHLEKFASFLRAMTEDRIENRAAAEWLQAAEEDDPVRCGFPRCKRHHTLLTFLGCQICNSTARPC